MTEQFPIADLCISNAHIVTTDSRYFADILVNEGKISALCRPGRATPEDAYRTIDAQGLYVLPGCIDAHVHFRDPGLTYKETFVTGSKAAAAGGITMGLDMPNTKPHIVSAQALAAKKANAQGRAYVDYGFYAMLTNDNLDSIPALIQEGARAFKCYMAFTQMKNPQISDSMLREGLLALKGTGLPLIVHAENTDLITRGIEKMKALGREDYLAYLDARPSISEYEPIQRAVMMAEETGGKLHVAHIAAKESVQIIREAKRRGVDVTCETGPQALIFSAEDYNRIGPALYVNPPVRHLEDQAALWEGLRDGTIDYIATDHAPHTKEEKYRGAWWECQSGCPGIETNVPVLLTKVNEGFLSLEQYVAVSSANAAKRLNLYPHKGCIQVGSDASFTIVDMEKEHIIQNSQLKSVCTVTPYDGVRVQGMPVFTIVRGHVVMEQGKISDDMHGEFI